MVPRSAVLGGGDACELRHWEFGVAPDGATKGWPGWVRLMRTAPLVHSVEPSMGPREAVLCVGGACELRHCDP
eukprot:9397792-Pyramimonas_sp.AAC.1